ncbi:MAG: hypothetical protein CME86_20750 [Herbaspirillum sp.]|nr:hypothetical protein [Herbaspirillum sp.]MBO15161.1 hypothetical protein [Herbaspirillum sp.]|tara:strand:+ start:1283 stop:1561 length:279 start_codon:yes stop_codon:yes gene_type:complete
MKILFWLVALAALLLLLRMIMRRVMPRPQPPVHYRAPSYYSKTRYSSPGVPASNGAGWAGDVSSSGSGSDGASGGDCGGGDGGGDGGGGGCD